MVHMVRVIVVRMVGDTEGSRSCSLGWEILMRVRRMAMKETHTFLKDVKMLMNVLNQGTIIVPVDV
ncbi:hypothetical protein LguiB_006031 [Lonicera macranthoides]